MKDVFACPVCSAPLHKVDRSYRCQKRHSFDVSAKRYVNLLVGADGAVHGDNKEMILARHRFLNGGWYQPLRQSVQALCVQSMPVHGVLLDCGCGEGYYTDGICQALEQAGKDPFCIGIDISKDAVILAGKTEPAKKETLELAVASAYRLPILDESCDMVVSLFAPLSDASFLRVLKKGGYLLLGIPKEKHLWGLKQMLYDTPYENDEILPQTEKLRLVSQRKVTAQITLASPEDIDAVFRMTPYYFHTSQKDKEKLLALQTLETPIEFVIGEYEK